MAESSPKLVALPGGANPSSDGSQANSPEFGRVWEASIARQAGPRALVELAFEHHHGMVFRVAHRILDDRAEAEDVTQSVFEILARRLDSVRDPAKLPGFLKTCAVRECLALRRRRRFWTRGRGAIYLEEPGAADPRAHDVAAARQLLAHLSDEERAVVVLKFVEHHSHEEVAALVGTSVSTVRRRLDAARRRLRRLDHPARERLLNELEDSR